MLSSFFAPASVAVVGAADDVGRLRGKLLKYALDSGLAAPIHPVNPKGGTIQGRTAYRSLAEIPGGAELVLIASPGETVPDVIREAIAIGNRAAVILSSGVDVAALEAAIGDSGLRYMGPNTEGYYSVGGVAATFAHEVGEHLKAGTPARRPGRTVSIVSQSGGLGFALLGRAVAENIDIHSVITTGNEGDLECLDMVEHVLDAGEAGVILMFVEGLKTASRFAAVAGKAADRGVPIVVMKVGRSEAGQRAAVSHTAHLTGADTAYDAMFERYGVIRVFDQEEMLATAAALARFPHVRVRRAAVMTTSGGAGAWAADICGMAGIDVPLLSADLRARLGGNLPDFGSAANPIDMTAQAVDDGGTMLLATLDLLAHADEVDAVIVNMGLFRPGRIAALEERLRPVLARTDKPILWHSHILPIGENMAALAALGNQAFLNLRGCAAALAALERYAAFQERWRARPAAPAPGAAKAVGLPDGTLDEAATRTLLDGYAIPVPPSVLANSTSAAIAAAASMGYPVALKIQSPDIAHKTEAGGVALGIGEGAVAAAYDRIIANAAAYAPDARIEGVLVQKMMPSGHELVVGVVRDPDFGPLLLIGAGGIYLEVLKDVVFSPVPVSDCEALALIERLKTAPILKGVRGQPPADIAALARLVSQVSVLAHSEPGIDQLDLNPVFVYPEGQGVVAVDALIVAGNSGGDDDRHSS